jgi:hypothetical protein
MKVFLAKRNAGRTPGSCPSFQYQEWRLHGGLLSFLRSHVTFASHIRGHYNIRQIFLRIFLSRLSHVRNQKHTFNFPTTKHAIFSQTWTIYPPYVSHPSMLVPTFCLQHRSLPFIESSIEFLSFFFLLSRLIHANSPTINLPPNRTLQTQLLAVTFVRVA